MNKPSPDYLTTQEVAELLRIKERKVYELVSSGQIPCTRATGKLLFPHREIEAWLGDKASGLSSSATPRPKVFVGSHDPLLDWALKESGCGLATNFNGSSDGLDRFEEGEGVAAAIHLYEADSDGWNTETVKNRFSGRDVVLVEFCWRERGLVVSSQVVDKIKTIADLKGRKVVPRQESAGSQILLLKMMQQQGIEPDQLEFGAVAHTETDAVNSVFDGTADATLGLRAVAHRFNLEFVTLKKERFDLLVERRSWFEPSFQSFLTFCRSKTFVERAETLHGYDVTGFGSVHFNG